MPLLARPGHLRPCLPWLAAFAFAFVLSGCGSGIAAISTTIQPLASENLGSPCTYDLLLAPASTLQVDEGAIKGILVMYARADTDALYQDQTLRTTAQALHLAIVWAHECNARTFSDLQADASKGPTRMLFAALSYFAQITDHPELNTAGVILYGFSAAGVLTATMANDHPERLLGTIQYAAGSAYVDLDQVTVTPGAAAVPTLILANADDQASGTSRSYRYFERGRALGAPWAYGVQNSTAHCCNLSTLGVIVPWIQAIAVPSGSTKLQPAVPKPLTSVGIPVRFVCSPDATKDAQGEVNCHITAASLGTTPPSTVAQDTGWLPTEASGTAWLQWVTNAATN